jgi:hypothetical protein
MAKLAALGVLVFCLAACASAGESPAQSGATTSTTAAVGTTTTTFEEPTLQTLPTSEDDLLALAKEARSALAEQLGVPEDEIAITGAAAVTWNDGSIGCPQPDMSYTQALIDGARVTLLHDDTTYSYHQSGDGLFLCEEPAEGSYVVSKGDSGELELIPPPGYDE